MTHVQILQIIGASALLAAVPALAWGYLFYSKNKENRTLLMVTFLIGGFAVFPILFYRWLWKFFPWINVLNFTDSFKEDLIGWQSFALIPLSVILTFMIIGVIEEVMKQSVVHAVDDNSIDSIDDAIVLSIFAALGFSFAENIVYFHNIWVGRGVDALLVPFVFRSIFSTFAHVLFSGIFGYYYGIAHFSTPMLQEELRGKENFIWRYLYRIFRLKTDELFHEQKMFQGLFIAVILHAVYNVFLEMNWTFLMVPYLVFGYMLLSHLLQLKENHKKYGLLTVGSRNNDYVSLEARLIAGRLKLRKENKQL
ncbi:MAG: PrsW family glutamic-type intramembrane protease [Patescibacteria group bacterium]